MVENRPQNDYDEKACSNISSIKLSIIIPAYNSAKYLSYCLDSLLEQDNPQYEVFCIDDGSEDNSLEIIKKYEEKFHNFYVIEQVHQGLSAARNQGLKYAKGEYVYFMDSDDILVPDFIASALQKVQEYQLDVLLFSFENFCDDSVMYEKYKERIQKIKRVYGSNGIKAGIDMMSFLMDVGEYYPMVWIQITRRKLLMDKCLLFYKGIVFEDVLYTFQLLWYAKRVMCITDVGYRKRMHSESICGRPENLHNVESMWKNYTELMVLCESYGIENDTEEYVAKSIINKSVHQLLLHFNRLKESDKEIFIKNCSRWDRIRFFILNES